jgi:Tfp pilus assembly major pilin PilA
MHKADVIIIVAAFAAIGFSLYRKYIRKDQGKTGRRSASQYGSSVSSPPRDDDYEPYSKK